MTNYSCTQVRVLTSPCLRWACCRHLRWAWRHLECGGHGGRNGGRIGHVHFYVGSDLVNFGQLWKWTKSGLIWSSFKVDQISAAKNAPAGHLGFLYFPLVAPFSTKSDQTRRPVIQTRRPVIWNFLVHSHKRCSYVTRFREKNISF
jgi:hypothetical protein